MTVPSSAYDLPQPHPSPAAVLGDELDARLRKRSFDGLNGHRVESGYFLIKLRLQHNRDCNGATLAQPAQEPARFRVNQRLTVVDHALGRFGADASVCPVEQRPGQPVPDPDMGRSAQAAETASSLYLQQTMGYKRRRL